MPAQEISGIVSENGSSGSGQNHPLQGKTGVLVGEKAGEH